MKFSSVHVSPDSQYSTGTGCELLSDYWEAAFAAEWRRIEPKLADAVAESGRALASTGIWAVLGRLPPCCRPDPERNELVVDLPHDHELEISDANPLVLSPSVFAWPHLRLNCDPPWPTAIVYAAPFVAREAAPRIPPDELLRVLRALGDDTRLRILKLVAERPRTTQELGPLVGLSAAGLSKSLRRLADAGLVTSHREGYYIVYTLEPARLAEPEGMERVRVGGEEATLVVWSPDYDGKGKAWVRFDDGRDAIVGGSHVERL